MNYVLALLTANLASLALTPFAVAQRPDVALPEAGHKTVPAPERTLMLSRAYQNRANWYRKTPQFNLDSAAAYFNKAVVLLENTRPLPYQRLAEVYSNLSEYNYWSYGYVRANEMAAKAWSAFESMTKQGKQDRMLQYEILRNHSFAKLETGDPKRSLTLMLKALALWQDDVNPAVQAKLLANKGSFYAGYSNGIAVQVRMAFRYLRESNRLYESLDNQSDDPVRAEVYKDLIWYYNVTENADSCDYYFAKLNRILPRLNDPIIASWYYSLRGNTLSRRNQYDQARILIQESLKILETYKLERTHIYQFNIYLLGVIATKKGRYDEAVAYFVRGRELAVTHNFPVSVITFSEHMADLYERKGDLKQALFYYRQWSEAMMKFREARSEKSLRENELQLNVVSQQKKLTEQRAERSSFITAIVIAALITGLLVMVLFGLYRNFRNKQRVNSQLEALNADLAGKNSQLDKRNAENELLLKEIHHRVKNNLEVVSSLLALQSAQINDPDVQKAMQSSQSRVQSMGILHQKLYQSEHLAFVEMRQYFVSLSENILNTYNETDRITVDCPMNEIELDVDTAIPVGLIVNELLTNSLKYAFPGGQLGRVLLSLEDLGRDMLQLRISDNGIGKAMNVKPQGTGFGTQLVSLLTRQLEGTLQQDIANGTVISIQFKKARPA